jgi:hypothetical protein
MTPLQIEEYPPVATGSEPKRSMRPVKSGATKLSIERIGGRRHEQPHFSSTRRPPVFYVDATHFSNVQHYEIVTSVRITCFERIGDSMLESVI